jgi:hypothetical protein
MLGRIPAGHAGLRVRDGAVVAVLALAAYSAERESNSAMVSLLRGDRFVDVPSVVAISLLAQCAVADQHGHG